MREKNKYKVANLAAAVNTDVNVYKDRDCTVSDLFLILLTKQGDSKKIGDNYRLVAQLQGHHSHYELW